MLVAVAVTLREFCDLGRSVTLIFVLIDHFLYFFSTIFTKLRKLMSKKFEIFVPLSNGATT